MPNSKKKTMVYNTGKRPDSRCYLRDIRIDTEVWKEDIKDIECAGVGDSHIIRRVKPLLPSPH